MRMLFALLVLPVCFGQSYVLSFRTFTDRLGKDARKATQRAARAYQKGNREECAKNLALALQEAPDSIRVLTMAGAFAMENRQFEESAQFFERAANLAPTDPELLSYAAVARGVLADLPSAARYSRQSLRYDPAHRRSNFVLGMSLAVINRELPDAARHLLRASDTHPEALLYLSWVWARLGDKDRAAAACHTYLGRLDEPLDTCLHAVTGGE